MSSAPGAPSEPPATLIGVLRGWSARQPRKRLYTYLSVGDGEAGERLSYAELDRRARAIAARLQELGLAGERALLLYPPGLEFIAAFLGCLYAGVVAVPASMGRANRPGSRLRAVAADARPRAVLTVASLLPDSGSWAAQVPELDGLHRLSSDDIDGELAGSWRDPRVGTDDLAFLQYTSGSTSAPKGVMVTHGNLVDNSELIRRCFGTVPDGEGVTWLPFHHDMGLIGGLLQALYCGASCTLLSPAAFLQRPLRWVEAVSRTGALVSGGPNFAYGLCADRATPERIAGLDLSAWRVAFNGAEPVRAETMERFAEAFAPFGFRREAFLPCYGMAETTLMVSGGPWQAPPVVLAVRAAALEQGRVEPAEAGEAGARPVVGCGQVPDGMRVAIADPETGARAPEGRVGEVWVAGPSVAVGYWGRPEETEQTFGAQLAGDADGPLLRTGDLGFVRGGELFITGRLKDLIIVRGRNVYPQDVEWVAGRSHPALQPDAAAAFAVEAGGQERLVVVQELDRPAKDVPVDEVVRAVRESVAEQLELDVYAVALLRRRSLPRTSSGKVQRHVCRALFLEGGLDEVARSLVEPSDDPLEPTAARATPDDRPGVARAAEEIRDWLATRLAAVLGVPPPELDVHQPLGGSGLTSVQVIGLAGELQEWLGRPLSPTLVYEYPTIDELSRYLAGGPAGAAAGANGSAPPAGGCEPIALIGVGCRFPGAEGPDGFWRLLRDGVDAVGPPPPGRWDDDGPAEGPPRRGGFIEGVDRFDADFFGISPREAARTDPQQRLLLEVAWEALEDAGQAPGRLAGAPVGVFVGISTRDYGLLLGDEADDGPGGSGFRLTGNAASIAANRLSYAFNFRGPSLAVDTACSSSLVAVHLACEALRAGEATLALAGGVNLMLAREVMDGLAGAGFLSATGRCMAFDERADGYARGEGAGLVVLKPLARALADGDPIYAVIRGGAVNQDGRTVGLTAPSRKAQEAVLRAACARAGVDPGRIGYVEAHGTGTLLGDPIEAKALGAVVGAGRPAGRPCLIGSVKTNVGHLEAAAGVAGLIKLALALKHREIPRSLHFNRPNPLIPFDELRLGVARERLPWPGGDGPALAGVSSFGFGGTNAHLVLQGVDPAPAADDPAPDVGAYLVPLSARHPESLAALARSFREALADGLPGASLRDIASTAANRRDHHDHRLALVARSRGEAVALLDAFLAGEPSFGLVSGRRPPTGPPRLALVFPGEGSLSREVCLELLRREPAFRDALERCDEAFRPLAGRSLVGELTADGPATRLAAAEFAQPALVAVQVALASLWRSWGVEPSAAVGHGLGEVAAAHVAGALDLPEALRIAARRGGLMRGASARGRTVAVAMPAEEARLLTSLLGDRLTIAAVDGPTSITLSGDAELIEEIRKQVEARGASARTLDADLALHGHRMEPVRVALEAALDGLRPTHATIPFVSTVTGRMARAEDLGPGYWGRNLRQTVLFAEAVNTLVEEGCTAFVELGPLPVLTEAIAQVLRQRERPGALVTCLRPREDGQAVSLGPLGALYAAGFPVAWERVNPPGRFVRLPSYPWRHRRHWIDAGVAGRPAGKGRHESPWAEAAPVEEPRPPDGAGPAPASDPDVDGLLYELQWAEKDRARKAPAEVGGRWLILEDSGGVGRALARLLEDRGATCSLVCSRGSVRADRAFGQVVDPADAEALSRLLAVPAGGQPYRGVVHLWGLDAADPDPERATAAEVAEAEVRACGGLLNLARAVSGSPATRLWVVTRGAQPVDPGSEPPALLPGALWGMGRSLAVELPGHWGGLVDLDRAPTEGEAAALLVEVAAPDGEDQVVFRRGVRHVARLARRAATGGAPAPPALGPAGTYLVAGGLDALGLHAARWLIGRGAQRLVLVGRDGLPDRTTWDRLADDDPGREAVAAIQDMERQGASVFVHQVDLADDAAMEGLFKTLRRRLPPVRGIVLAADIVGPLPADGSDPAALSAVLRPGVAGVWNLYRCSRGLPIDFFVGFSTLASVFGLDGPAAAAAGGFLGSFAHAARGWGLAALGINWGNWDGAGPAAPTGREQPHPIPCLIPLGPARAFEAMERLLVTGAAQAVVADLDWDRLNDARDGGRPSPFLEPFCERPEPPSGPSEVGEAEPGDWRAMPADRRRDWLLRLVRDKVAAALEQEPEEVGTDRPLSSMGVDSITAMEIKWAVEDGLGVSLPVSSLADGPTIAVLVDRALEMVASGASGSVEADDPNAGPSRSSDGSPR
jgi:acyl transferase domain-containing protein/acyl-CoA synthetase (AMP-forming)/AMP-acid ligase II/acyl carrier protein